jgi:hypothetical protein
MPFHVIYVVSYHSPQRMSFMFHSCHVSLEFPGNSEKLGGRKGGSNMSFEAFGVSFAVRPKAKHKNEVFMGFRCKLLVTDRFVLQRKHTFYKTLTMSTNSSVSGEKKHLVIQKLQNSIV